MKYKLLLTLLFLQNILIAKDTVVLQLHWKHQFQYAGFYTAIKKGYYQDLGINLSIKEWNPQINKLENLRSDNIDFLISSSDMLGEVFKSNDLLIVASYLQKTPIALAVKPNLYFPSDLKNKKIMAIKDDIQSSVFYKMWKTSNIQVETLDIKPHSFNMESFINGKVDAVQIYMTDQPFELASKNIKFNIIDSNSYGIDFYDLMVLTTKKLALSNPQLVQNFKEATTKGWEYALKNKEEIVELILEKYNTQNKSKEELLFEAKRLENFILPQSYKIGELNKNKLQKIALLHLEMGNINKINNIQNFIFSYKNFDRNLNLTEEEKMYLKKKNILNICTIPNNIFLEDKNFYKSIDIKIMEEIIKKLKINHKFIKTKTYEQSINYTKNGTCDVLSITRYTKERDKILNINTPYVAQPLVMVSNNDVLFIEDFSKIKNKTIAISNDDNSLEKIHKLYPNLKVIEVASPEKALELLKRKEIFGFVDMPIVISHYIKQLGYLDLKIIGSLKISSGISMASTKQEPLLSNILEKSLNIIPEDYINTLINEWYAIKYEKGIDYTLISQITIFAILSLILMWYWNRKIKHTNILLVKTQKELEEKNHKLEQISITDRLTNLFNRHKIDHVLDDAKARCDRYNETFGIIMLDIDHFKSVNDTYGHQVGDIVLIEIANILKSTVRKTDIIGRWGGEEFLIVCINSDLESTKVIAEKCRKAVDIFNFTTVKHKTSSFGVSIYDKNKSIKETISQADNNLYRAKNSGRNKVVF